MGVFFYILFPLLCPVYCSLSKCRKFVYILNTKTQRHEVANDELSLNIKNRVL